MTMVWSPDYEDAPATYIAAVEAADGQGLEEEVKAAYTEFILGCISDGIWDAIKASCILAGARTTNGALVPLKGTAPTSFNFDLVNDTDYDRKTGLVGDGSTKYLDSNRNNNADPENDKHVSAYVTVLAGVGPFLASGYTTSGAGITWVGPANSATNNIYNLNASTLVVLPSGTATGFYGIDRSSTAQVTVRYSQTNNLVSNPSALPYAGSITIQKVDRSTATSFPDVYGSSRIAFYSIGSNLNLAKLDTRVTDLITAIGAAIP